MANKELFDADDHMVVTPGVSLAELDELSGASTLSAPDLSAAVDLLRELVERLRAEEDAS